jgi:NAD(P)-dependent dehydrogenase (short-subunit alcohol dehydrogenase family)
MAKTWLITGMSRGFGKALAEAAMARGDMVIGTTRDGASPLTSDRCRVVAMELTDPASVRAAVDSAFAIAGRIDVIVNNAGYGLLGALEDAAEDEVERLLAVDLLGPLRLIRAALPRLRAQQSGHILTISSFAGLVPQPGASIYAAAKAGVDAMHQSLAKEVAEHGIKVTVISPGAFRTDFLAENSIRRSHASSDAYDATVGAMMRMMDQGAGRQVGDPVRAATAIIAAVDAAEPPLQLVLGSSAWQRTRDLLDAKIAELETWKAVSASTDFPAGS